MYLSGADHPAVTARGGMLAGLPLITSSSVPQVGTGNELLVLADGGGIAIAQDPTFNMQTVSEAAVEMDDAPIGSSVDPMPTTLVSLFQVDASALAIDHRCNWKIIRAGSVATLSVATS